MFKKILVPVDGSAFAESAIPLALRLADASEGEVRLAMVSEPANMPPGLWAETFLKNHAQYLELIGSTAERLATDTVTTSSTLLEGPVADALCGEAEAWSADLIMMSTHGHGGLTRVWLGSVADALLRESPVPVLLVRPEETEDGATAPDTIEHIAVALDGSEFAEAAVAPALELGETLGAPVTLLRSVSYPVLVSSYLPDTAEENEAFIRHAEEEATDYLDLVRSRVGAGAGTIELEVLVNPSPARAVLKYLQKHPNTLVAMATHARHGIARVAIGSVADKVIRGAHTPVLVVHPRGPQLHEHSEEVA